MVDLLDDRRGQELPADGEVDLHSPDQRRTFRQFIKDFYRRTLDRGTVRSASTAWTFKNVGLPRAQHLRPAGPPRAAERLEGAQGRTGSKDYTELAFPGPLASTSRQAQKEVTPAIGKWLNERS